MWVTIRQEKIIGHTCVRVHIPTKPSLDVSEHSNRTADQQLWHQANAVSRIHSTWSHHCMYILYQLSNVAYKLEPDSVEHYWRTGV